MNVRASNESPLDWPRICKPFTRRYSDPDAPYDGYVEDDDTEEKARSIRLPKKKVIRT